MALNSNSTNVSNLVNLVHTLTNNLTKVSIILINLIPINVGFSLGSVDINNLHFINSTRVLAQDNLGSLIVMITTADIITGKHEVIIVNTNQQDSRVNLLKSFGPVLTTVVELAENMIIKEGDSASAFYYIIYRNNFPTCLVKTEGKKSI